uniref:Isopropylmalate dehydrogenase-like domain-containing protein n=2 Tax=Latimeria chalumnae TaxID=7897 RepID=H3AHE6_LATCH
SAKLLFGRRPFGNLIFSGTIKVAQEQPLTEIKREFCAKPQITQYGGRRLVTMIPGDGIGPEIMRYIQEVFSHAGVPVDFEVINVNSSGPNEEINNAISSLRKNGTGIKGSIETNHDLPPNYKSKNVLLRTNLDLFANLVHHRNFPGLPSKLGAIDIVVIRENTEGEYSNLEHENVPGVVECLKIITRHNSLRIARYAFDYARKHGRKKVTAVHKANIMKLGDGLFLDCCKKVASDYPDIAYEQMIVDNTAMQLVDDPAQFDVMVMPNLYGNIVNNICTGLVGGPGLVPGANYGHKYSLFEAGARHSGKSIANRNLANPTAMLLASCLMLDHLELKEYAWLIRNAAIKSIGDLKIQTVDLGGSASTTDVIHSVLNQIDVAIGRKP